MRIKLGAGLLTCVALLAPVLTCADVLKAPGENASLLQLTDQPRRGSTKQQVEAKFGVPVSREGPVGDPPISRWNYDRYSVFFEHNHVVHSVVHYSATQKAE